MSKAAGFTHDNVNNASVDWYTPAWVFEELNLQFDLDPCHPSTKSLGYRQQRPTRYRLTGWRCLGQVGCG